MRDALNDNLLCAKFPLQYKIIYTLLKAIKWKQSGGSTRIMPVGMVLIVGFNLKVWKLTSIYT